MTDTITRSLTVACDPTTAFRVFTREIGTWWPTEQHSLHPGAVAVVVWEEHEGGKVYEVSTEGERGDWATVLTWEPPTRFVLAWHVTPEHAGTEIDVRFSPVAAGTLVELEHRGFEGITDGAEMRESYSLGWPVVLGRFASALPQPADPETGEAPDETSAAGARQP
jgi:hypothetical protein